MGGNVGTTSVKLLPEVNTVIYGKDVAPETVLASEGKLAQTEALRRLLQEAVKASWGH